MTSQLKIDYIELPAGEKSDDRKVTRWTELTGKAIKDDMEESILDLKRRMPCIRRSQNFDDLSQCMHDDNTE